jgi:hypothetical protein
MALLLVVLAGVLASAGCAAPSGPPDPRTMVPPGVRAEWLHFADATAGPGDPAPDFDLPLHDGSARVSLSFLRGRPVVLVFGSYT